MRMEEEECDLDQPNLSLDLDTLKFIKDITKMECSSVTPW